MRMQFILLRKTINAMNSSELNLNILVNCNYLLMVILSLNFKEFLYFFQMKNLVIMFP